MYWLVLKSNLTQVQREHPSESEWPQRPEFHYDASKDAGNRDHTGNARSGRDVFGGADAGTAANSGGGADAKIL